MADSATPRRRLSVAEFLQWDERQQDRFELLDGIPQAMAGGSRNHNMIALNIVAALRGRLRGTPRMPFSSDLKTEADGDIYYPDVTVDCGRAPGTSFFSASPTIVFEVLSRTTRHKDFHSKLPNYQATPMIQQIVYVESETQALTVWMRDGAGWKEQELEPNATLHMPSVGAELSFAEIYEDVDFAAE